MKKFITNNVHFFVIAAILIAGYAIYKTVKSEKAITGDTPKVIEE